MLLRVLTEWTRMSIRCARVFPWFLHNNVCKATTTKNTKKYKNENMAVELIVNCSTCLPTSEGLKEAVPVMYVMSRGTGLFDYFNFENKF